MRRKPKRPPSAGSERPARGGDPRRRFVVVVDDDVSLREALPDLLGEFGFSSIGYPSAEAFLASGRLHEVDCLLLDVAMPGMTGPELQGELTRRGLAMPIVFITAHKDETLRQRLLHAGATECLNKPFSEAALREALARALRSRR